MEYQKITNLLSNISHKVPRCITKIWVSDQSWYMISLQEYTTLTSK